MTEVTGEQIIQRARDMRGALAQRFEEGNRTRKLPKQSFQDMVDAGFFRILQPKRWGGYELDPQVFFETQWTLASADPSCAWVLGVIAVHAWQLAIFPLKAQEEVWGSDSSVLISSSYAPTGKVKAVEGGFEISGRWGYSSGSDYCDWVFLGGFVPQKEGPPEMRTFLVPRKDYVIEDTWKTMGLRGTGSNDIVVEKAFVPEHRTHLFSDGFKQDSPGNEVNEAPLFRLPFGQIFVRSVSTSAIGMLEGALNAYLDVQKERVAASDGAKSALDPSTQIAASHAETALDECKVVLLRNFDEMMGLVRAGERIPISRRVKFRNDSGAVTTKCMAAIDELMNASGGRAVFEGNQVQRFFLDIHAARAHYANNPDKPSRNFGGVQMGARTNDYFI